MADETSKERAARYAEERKQRDADRTALQKRERWQWIAVGLALAAVVGSGLKFYFWLVPAPAAVAARWGDLGSAVAPFVAVLTVGALLAALWSVHLQRIELRETREEMFEQRMQFERTAEAQEALAASQKRLADTQVEGNRIAIAATQAALAAARNGISGQHAQRASNVATYMAAIAHVRASIGAARSGMTGNSQDEKELLREIQALGTQRDVESKRMSELEKVMKDIDEGPNA